MTTAYDALFDAAGKKHNVDPALLRAIAEQESGFNPKAKSPVGAQGLMQIMPATARLLGVKDAYDPPQAIDGAAKLLAEAMDRNGNVEDAITEYHGGPDRKLWGPKTRAYRSDVLAKYRGAGAGGQQAMTTEPTDDELLAMASGKAPPPASGAAPGPGGGLSDDALLGMASGDTKAFAAAGVEPDLAGAGITPYRGLKSTLTKDQQSIFETMNKGGRYRPDDPDGTVFHPFFMQPGTTEDMVPAGAYYVTQDGKIGRAAGGEDGAPKAASSFSRGIGDVGLSVLNLAPGGDDSELRNRMKIDQAVYDANDPGTLTSGLARFGGQMVGSVPLLAGGEAALAPLLANMGPVGAFVAGKAGQAALPEAAGAVARLGKLGTRAASLAASGAAEGAGASALVSSTSDEPLKDQMLTGAVLGAAVKPAGKAVYNGMLKFLGPKTAGALPAIEQARIVDASKGLPVEVPLTKGEITSAPAQQMMENAMLRGGSGDAAAGVMQGFKGAQQEALRSNVQAIRSSVSGGQDIAPGEGAAAVSGKLNKMRDAADKAVDDAYDAARAVGNDAMLTTAKESREAMLGALDGFELSEIPKVAAKIEAFGSEGAPTVRQIFDLRAKLSKNRMDGGQEAAAAGTAIKALDKHLDQALTDNLLVGDADAVKAWREAIGKRAEFGRLFEGDDLIDKLTERVSRGGSRTLAVDPDEAANYILGREELGFAGKKNLTRDLKRLRDVLTPESPEWNGLRSEIFSRIARAGEGAPEAGGAQFSGQKFLKAWNTVKEKNSQVLGVVFTPEERKLIDNFAEIAQRATTPVKGGDNPSNSAITGKRLLAPAVQAMRALVALGGGAAAGSHAGPEMAVAGAAAGAALNQFFKLTEEALAAGKARAVTYGARPMTEAQMRGPRLKLPSPTAPAAAAIAAPRFGTPPAGPTEP